MKVAVSSIAGDPRDPRTWSNAPAHLIGVLEKMGHTVTAIDSRSLTWFDKTVMGISNAARGLPWNVVSWFEPARRKRARALVDRVEADGCDLVICTGTLDAPVGLGFDYAIWLDNTFALLQRSAVALPYAPSTVAEIERLDRSALQGARAVLTFSEHVRSSVIQDYGVSSTRVHTVGCGSGPLRPFCGEKDFSEGHLLFVAKHLFGSKGGDVVLKAFPLIRAVRPETRLILIGNDEAREKARGVAGVEVHGFVEREVLENYFHGAAMLVQPMFADPWGQVYLEAMKARAVIVSLNVAALPELTDYGRLGVLIERAEPKILADAVLATYSRSQTELDRLTCEAQARTLAQYSWDAVGERFAQALKLHEYSTEAGE